MLTLIETNLAKLFPQKNLAKVAQYIQVYYFYLQCKDSNISPFCIIIYI